MAVRGRAAAVAAAAAMAAVDRRLPNLDDFAGQSWSAWVERAGPPAAEAGERACPVPWLLRQWRGTSGGHSAAAACAAAVELLPSRSPSVPPALPPASPRPPQTKEPPGPNAPVFLA